MTAVGGESWTWMLNSVHQADCVAGMASLPAGSIDLAFADPPFNIGYDYDVYDDRREREVYLDWSKQWIAGVYRALKPNGTFWLAIGDEYAAELKVISQDVGFTCRSWVVWYYTFGVNCKNKFSRSHAHLFHFIKDPNNFTFRSQAPENRLPSARLLVYGDARANPNGRLPDDTWILRPQDLSACFTAGEDTWYFPRVAGTFKERAGFHGCQMPEQLLGRIIRLCSHEDEVVMDPFAGSSTTLVVAKKLARRFLGFELSTDYAKRGAARLEHVRRGDPLEGAAEPTISAPSTAAGRKLGEKVSKEERAKRRAEAKAKALAQKSAPETGPVGPNETGADAPALDAAAAPGGTPQGGDESLETVLERSLVDAFRQVNDGYSLDRVIADPDLCGRLIETCQRMGLPGEPRTWNWRLLNYRKQGRLADLLTTRRTEMSWTELDAFLHGAEQALALLLSEGAESVDDLLCDPQLSARFDQLASGFAPGFTPLQYRWSLLKLRKEAKIARARAKSLTPARLSTPVPIADLAWDQLSEGPGGYLVTAGAGAKPQALYAGQTLNLRQRLHQQFDPARQNAWRPFAAWSTLKIRTFAVSAKTPELLAFQSQLITRHRPKLNFAELGEPEKSTAG